MLNVNIYRRTYVNDVKRERAHERQEHRKMIILLNILGSNPLMTIFGPSPQYLTLLTYVEYETYEEYAHLRKSQEDLTTHIVVCFILSRLLYLAFSSNLGLLCMPHPGMGPLV